jgi:hypothetical protein
MMIGVESKTTRRGTTTIKQSMKSQESAILLG